MKRAGKVFEAEFFNCSHTDEKLLEIIEESDDLFITNIVAELDDGVTVYVGGSVQESIIELARCFGGELV